MEENFFDLLLREFLDTVEEEGGAKGWPASVEPPSADRFVEFCKRYLTTNAPAGTAIVARGLALRLQKGQVVTFSPPDTTPENPIRGVFVTNPGYDPQGMAPSHTVPITDPKR